MANPVLARQEEEARKGYATFHAPPSQTSPQGYQAPPGWGTQLGGGSVAGPTAPSGGWQTPLGSMPPLTTESRMTLDDVVVRTGLLFVILLAGAGVGWVTGRSALTFVAMFVALGLGLANSFMRTVRPALVMGYALAEGVFLGGISVYFNSRYPGVVQQAILGTLCAFAAMLILFSTKKIRLTPKVQRMFMVALLGYGFVGLISLVTSIFGVGGGWGFYGVGGIGLLLCLAGVGLATFSLIVDFDSIARGIEYGLPERESWRAGFGLLVTLVWLYLELLRLLSILRSN